MALFLQVSSSLAPMQYTGVCRIAQLPNRGWLLGFGREVFFPRHKCSVERTEYLIGVYLAWLYLFIYIAIMLYNYILIYLYRYYVIYLLYFFHIRYSIFRVSLSFGFLPCKGMAVLSDTKHQAMPYSAKTFPESLPQMLHIWVFQKTFYRIAWCSDFIEPPSSNARKKAI